VQSIQEGQLSVFVSYEGIKSFVGKFGKFADTITNFAFVSCNASLAAGQTAIACRGIFLDRFSPKKE